MSRLLAFHQKLLSDPTGNILTGLVFYLLIPFSLVYGVVSWLRLLCYQYGLLSSFKSSLPVISVGNLSAGGTGKTPVVDWLVKRLMEKGYHPAIVSRGYGGQFRGEVGFVSDGKKMLMNPVDSGDEPVLLAQRNPQVPVLIARKRVNAIKEIERAGCADVIILDDAFQHHAVARSLDIVLLDAGRPLGNGWPLPAGNLREFSCTLKRAGILVRTRSEENIQDIGLDLPVFDSRHQLAGKVISLSGEKTELERLLNLQLVAFAGIANPGSFFDALRKKGMMVKSSLAFSDHEPYSTQQLRQINQLVKGADALITTEKDAVKLSADMFQIPCYKVAVNLQVDNEAIFVEKVLDMMGRKT
ncbi:MAG: tetraacyldisaccharide 4'-kinase [Pelovirga sp.]